MSSEEIEPDAWHDGNELIASWVVEADALYDKSDLEPLYSAETIKQLIKDKRAEFNNGRSNEHPQKVLTELLEEVNQS